MQGPLIVDLGRQRRPLHPVCADDFAAQVVHAFETPEAENREFYVHGPEELTLHQALAFYRRIVAPDKRMVTIPLPAMLAIDRLFMHGKLAPNLAIMRLLARLGERGDPSEANTLLGEPATMVESWCHTRLATTGESGGS